VFTRRILLLLDVLCLAGVLWSAVLIGALLSEGPALSTGVAAGVAAALILPGFLAGVVSNRTTFRGRRPRDGHTPTIWRPPVDLPHWALIVAGLLFLGFWVAAMSGFAGIDQNDTGQDRTGYDQLVALGVLGAFGVGGTTLAAASATRARSGPPGRPDRVAADRGGSGT
jgi:hypothetical protein